MRSADRSLFKVNCLEELSGKKGRSKVFKRTFYNTSKVSLVCLILNLIPDEYMVRLEDKHLVNSKYSIIVSRDRLMEGEKNMENIRHFW